MATVQPTILRDPLETGYDRSIILVTWVLTTANFDGAFVSFPEYADKTASIGNASGDAFGTATCAIQGKNASGDTEQTLNKPVTAAAATATAAASFAIVENPLLIAPKLTAVGSGATITVRLLFRRANPLRQ
jgi:hypothetical protein